MRLKTIFTLIFIIFFYFFSYGQKRAKISGTVADTDANPLELAMVRVTGTVNGTLTDEKGHYTLYVSTKDSCSLTISCIGYRTITKTLPVVEDGMRVNIRLVNSDVELQEATVIGQRIETNTMKTISAGNRLLSDPSGGNVEYMLATEIGVSSTNELSTQYSVRGGNYDENMVYVNGVEVYRPLLVRSGQQEGLSFVNPDMTEEVKFSSGGFESKFGDKMSSVLDITYKKPKELEGSVSASLMGASAYVGTSSKKFTQVTGFRFKKNSLLLGTLDTKGEYDPTFIDLQTYMTYKISPRLEWNFLGNFSKNQYNFTPTSRSTSFGTIEMAKNFTVYFDGKERDNFETLFGSTGFTYRLKSNTDVGLQVSAFQSKEEETYDITGEYWLSDVTSTDEATPENMEVIGTGKYHEHARNRLRSDVVNISHVGTHKMEAHTIRWGLGYQVEKIKDRIKEWEMRDSAGYSLPYNNETVNMVRNLYSHNDLSSNRFSGYIQDTYKFRNSKGLFSLTGGIRGSYWDFNKEFIFSPRASVGFVPNFNQKYTFRFATGIYYQAPFYKEFQKTVTDEYGNSVIELNHNIKSQRSIHFVLGGDYSFTAIDRPFKFTAEMYYKKLDNLVPYTVDNVKVRYYGENIASGYAAGLDMKLFGEFVPGTDSWLTFSLMKTQQDIYGVKVPLPTDQQYNISLFFTDYFPGYDKIRLNLRAIWADGLPVSPPGQGYETQYFRTPGYRRIDVGMSYQLLGGKENSGRKDGLYKYLKNVYLGLDCFNLFDINNVNSYYWVTDIYGQQYGVPNYLTGRQLNVKLVAEF